MAATDAFERACLGSFFILKSAACHFSVRMIQRPVPVSKSEFFRVYAQITMAARILLAASYETRMANDIQFRRPRIGPYISRFRNHWAWNAKSLLTPRQALHDRVQGKVVLLTGASSGIGEGVAEKLADAGVTLLLVARNA